MRKKALIIAALVGLVLAFWILSHFVRLPFFNVHPHAAIPAHTALFFVFEKSQIQEIANGNAPPVFSEMFLPETMREDFISYEAMFGEQLPFPSEEKTTVTVNPTRSLGIDLLFILPNYRGVDLEKALRKRTGNKVRTSIFQSQEVFTVSKNSQSFSLTKYRNLLLVARHAYLVENAIGQLKSPGSAVCSDPNFRSAKVASPLKDDVSSSYEISLNINELSAQFSPLLDPSKLLDISHVGEMGAWLRMVFPAQKEVAEWSAAFVPNPNQALFRASQKAPEAEVSSAFPFLPGDLTAFVWLSQNSFLPGANTEVWETHFAPWAETSATLALGEQLGNAPVEKFLLLKTNDPKLAEVSMEKMAAQMSGGDAFDVQLFTVWPIKGSRVSEIFGLGKMLENAYVTVLGEYVLFSNSKAGITRWLVKYMAGQTFAQKASFLKSLPSPDLKAQVFFYAESEGAWQFAKQFLSKKRGTFFHQNPMVFEHVVGWGKWEGKSLHCSISATQAGQKESSPAGILWRTPLAGNAVGSPVISPNPESSENEILVKDDEHHVYLISNNGRIIWQRQIEQPILSGITQIDLRNDGERQFVFSTPSAIHILDESGGDVAGFPLPLQVPATNGVTVVDFFQSHDYRFFIACENGNAYGFDERGSPVEGWRPKANIGMVSHPLLHFQAKGMDFLALLNGQGDLQVFQKNGKDRFPKVELESPFLQNIDYQSHRQSSRLVTCDDEGHVFVTNFKGDHFKLNLEVGKNEAVKFAFSDVTGDSRKDYVALSGTDLAAYFYEGKEFKKAWGHQFPWPQDGVFGVEIPGMKKQKTGTVSRSKKRIFLLEKNGGTSEGFPLEGTAPFVVSDLLGNGRKVVVTGNGRSVCAYSLE